jgi:hypothetical protein
MSPAAVELEFQSCVPEGQPFCQALARNLGLRHPQCNLRLTRAELTLGNGQREK